MNRKILINGTRGTGLKIILLVQAMLFITGFAFATGGHAMSNITDVKKVVVKEVKQTVEYTYLRVNLDSAGILLQDTLWIALPKTEAQTGDTLYYMGGFYIYDLKSRELNRNFKKILFLEAISKTAFTENSMPEFNSSYRKSDSAKQVKNAITKIDTLISPAPGGITIAQLFSDKTNYSGKTVKIHGQVTKFTSSIMNKNWIHVQDGTSDNGKYDLIVTTTDSATVGDIVTVEGKISLDKDFGFGYYYSVIMEDAKIIK